MPVHLGHGADDLHVGAWIGAGCINRSTRRKGQHSQAGDTLEMGISRDHDEVPLQSRRGDERVNVPYMSS